jgi:hypothetical protein
MSYSRDLWLSIETLHAVTYFAPESVQAANDAGLKGFWMGYFGFRSAPLGAVSPGLVHATFANFTLAMIERSIPDAWTYATPEDLLDHRARSAAAALRRLAPGQLESLTVGVSPKLREIIAVADPLGRPLFSANAWLEERSDPVEQFWQLCTSFREHRGDGHVLVLANEGISGCEAHILHAAQNETPAAILRENRGFSEDQWSDATERLRRRGLLGGSGLTASGWELRSRVENQTDKLSARAIDSALDEESRIVMLDQLAAVAQCVAASGALPYPNPMGLRQVTGAEPAPGKQQSSLSERSKPTSTKELTRYPKQPQ